MSPALKGGFLTTGLPGKSQVEFFFLPFRVLKVLGRVLKVYLVGLP